jgi:phosphatidylethanolamine-binding protein (PEBP) family uncharacterized protein
MYDPDAINGNFIHWLIFNIKSNRSEEDGDLILKYKGPSPPNRSRIHHYIFELYEQNNIISINIEENISREYNLELLKQQFNLSNLIDKIQFKSSNNSDNLDNKITNNNGGKKRKISKSKYRKTISRKIPNKKRKFSKKI